MYSTKIIETSFLIFLRVILMLLLEMLGLYLANVPKEKEEKEMLIELEPLENVSQDDANLGNIVEDAKYKEENENNINDIRNKDNDNKYDNDITNDENKINENDIKAKVHQKIFIELEDLQHKNLEYDSKIKFLNEEIKLLQISNIDLEKKCNEYKNEHDVICEQFTNFKNEYSTMKQHYEIIDTSNNDNNKHNNNNNGQIEFENNNHNEYKQQIEQFEKINEKLMGGIRILENECEKIKHEKENIVQLLKLKEEENEHLIITIDEWKNAYIDMKNKCDNLNQQIDHSNSIVNHIINQNNNQNNFNNYNNDGIENLHYIRSSMDILQNHNENEDMTLEKMMKENFIFDKNDNEITNSVDDDYEYDNKQFEMDCHTLQSKNSFDNEDNVANVNTNEQNVIDRNENNNDESSHNPTNNVDNDNHNNDNNKNVDNYKKDDNNEKEIEKAQEIYNNIVNCMQTYLNLNEIETLMETNNQNSIDIEKLRNLIIDSVKQQKMIEERSQQEIINLKNINKKMQQEYLKMRNNLNEKMKKLCLEEYKREYKTYLSFKEIMSETANKTWTHTWYKLFPFW